MKLDNLGIARRIALALALPMLGMFALSISSVAGYYRTAEEMARLRQVTEVVPLIASLIHTLQVERGVSVNIIAAAQSPLAERLPAEYQKTDLNLARLNGALDQLAADNADAKLVSQIALLRENLQLIEKRRRALAERQTSAPELTGQYASLIAELIGFVEDMRRFSSNVELTRILAAYTAIIHAKEYAGLERATGAIGFAVGYLDQGSYAKFIQYIERQQRYYEEFLLAASPAQAALLNRAFAGLDVAELERMRRIIIIGQEKIMSSGVMTATWFDACSRKIDRLKDLEGQIGSELIAQVRAVESSASRTTWQISVLFMLLLIVTVVLALFLARGIIAPLARITASMSKLAARDGTIDIQDDRRGDEIGDMARALIVFRDNLFKVAQAEERIKNEAILRLHHEALGAISQGVWIADAELGITYANPAFEAISGYSESEILGQTPFFLLHSNGETLATLGETLLSGRSFYGQLANFRKDGTPFWGDLSINPVRNLAGNSTHFVGVIRDITEHRMLQQELRIAATAFESLHGVMVTNTKGLILRVNKAFTEMTGYQAEEVVGKSPSILKSGRHEAAFYADMWRQLEVAGAWYGEIWDRRKNGEIFPKWQTISAVKGADGVITHYVAAFSDISESKAAEQEIRNLAFYDPLTQLPNRRLLIDRLQHALIAGARNNRNGALLFIDLDNFKTLNDTHGHEMGDLLLKQVTGRLTECVRGGDTVARLGGDEFVLIFEDLSADRLEAAAQAEIVAEKILDALNQPYILGCEEYQSTASIGVTLFSNNDASVDDLLRQADLAMYQSKDAGRNSLRFFQPDMQATVAARSAMESALRKGLRENQLLLHYQPQVNAAGRVTGAEALVRWQHPERGMVSPADFIPLAEQTGLILPLGLWVLQTACDQLATWASQPRLAQLTLAVNVSARQFRQPDFVSQVLDLLAETGANPAQLKLELTESMLVDNVQTIIEKMSALKEKGVGFSLDDFGTGYSSLTYLKRLPLDQLKIDQSFVREVLSNQNDAAIARTVVALAQSLSLGVIAEGVETLAQRDFLAASGCLSYQGYFFSRPLPIDDFNAYAQGRIPDHPAEIVV